MHKMSWKGSIRARAGAGRQRWSWQTKPLGARLREGLIGSKAVLGCRRQQDSKRYFQKDLSESHVDGSEGDRLKRGMPVRNLLWPWRPEGKTA